jgi:hypothetical protein
MKRAGPFKPKRSKTTSVVIAAMSLAAVVMLYQMCNYKSQRPQPPSTTSSVAEKRKDYGRCVDEWETALDKDMDYCKECVSLRTGSGRYDPFVETTAFQTCYLKHNCGGRSDNVVRPKCNHLLP